MHLKHVLRATAFAISVAIVALPAMADEFQIKLSTGNGGPYQPGQVVSGEHTSAAFQRPGGGWYGVPTTVAQGMADQLNLGAVTGRTVTIDDNSEFESPFSPCAIGLNPPGTCIAIKGVH